jgi:hypothetical protein
MPRGDNKKKNKWFRDAMKKIEKDLGKKIPPILKEKYGTIYIKNLMKEILKDTMKWLNMLKNCYVHNKKKLAISLSMNL